MQSAESSFALGFVCGVKSDLASSFFQLLGRLYSLLGENNPGLAGRTHMTVMTYPTLLREGTKKTVFVNFMDSCRKCVSSLLV
jgi:hypothetical protein